MDENISEIDQVRAKITAIRVRYQAEIEPFVSKLDKLEAEILAREGLLDIDPDEEAFREHLKLML